MIGRSDHRHLVPVDRVATKEVLHLLSNLGGGRREEGRGGGGEGGREGRRRGGEGRKEERKREAVGVKERGVLIQLLLN